MTEYIYNKQFPNETSIRIETNNRNFFIGIEQTINDFITQFTNEDSFKNEETNGFELTELNQNELVDLNRNEERRTVGNEDRNRFENFCGNEESSSISTKWGNAYLCNGYYRISSMEHRGKRLHRLIYEDYHKCTLLSNAHIHHLDGDTTNNNINNLKLVSPSEHAKITQENRKQKDYKELPLIADDCPVNDDYYWDYSNSLSEQRNTTGYLHVYKQVCPNCTQGFTYKYTWREEGRLRTLESVNINKLEQKVKAKGLPWQKL